jgi:hypothetical protein
VLITPSRGVSQLVCHLHQHRTAIKHFSGAVAREKEDFCKGSFARKSFTLFIVLLYFIFACIVLSKTQKISSFYSCYFCWSVIVLLYHAFYQWLVSLKLNLFGKVGSQKSNKNIMRNTACHKKGNTYGTN